MKTAGIRRSALLLLAVTAAILSLALGAAFPARNPASGGSERGAPAVPSPSRGDVPPFKLEEPLPNKTAAESNPSSKSMKPATPLKSLNPKPENNPLERSAGSHGKLDHVTNPQDLKWEDHTGVDRQDYNQHDGMLGHVTHAQDHTKGLSHEEQTGKPKKAGQSSGEFDDSQP